MHKVIWAIDACYAMFSLIRPTASELSPGQLFDMLQNYQKINVRKLANVKIYKIICVMNMSISTRLGQSVYLSFPYVLTLLSALFDTLEGIFVIHKL